MENITKKQWLTATLVVLFTITIAVLAIQNNNAFTIGNYTFKYFAAGEYSCGVFSAGNFSMGIFSIGIFSIGVFSLSIFNIGIYALGIFVITKRKNIKSFFHKMV